jgi:hypothetical protein
MAAAPKGNKYALGLTNNGRPPKYDNPDELANKINEYFESLLNEEGDDFEKRPTVSGLGLYLGFMSRSNFDEYAKKEDFKYIIKRAKYLVESSYEEMLLSKASTGAIFALKNMGWKDKTEVDQTITETKQVFKIGDTEYEL